MLSLMMLGLRRMKAGGYLSREDHDSARGEAEATATEWSKERKVDKLANKAATRQENNWYQFTKLSIQMDHAK